MTRIFVSYSRSDKALATRLTKALREFGAEFWIDVDDIRAGINWASAVQRGLRTCGLMLVLISPDSMKSRNVEDEWQWYRDLGKPVIPILSRPTPDDVIHFQLNRLQRIDFHGQDFRTALRQLHEELVRNGIELEPFESGTTFSQHIVDQHGNTSNIEYADDVIGEGEDGQVFVSTDEKHMIKLYHEQSRRNPDRLRRVLEKAPEPTDEEYEYLAWPLALVLDSDGYGVQGTVTRNFLKEDWMESLRWYLSPRVWLSRPADRRGDLLGRIKAAYQIATAVSYVNRQGYVFPNLGAHQFFINPVEGKAVLVDLDLLEPAGAPSGLGLVEYLAPEMVVTHTEQTNWHALAVLLYQLLLLHHPLLGGSRAPLSQDPGQDDLLQIGRQALYKENPDDASNRPPGQFLSAAMFGETIKALFERAFVSGLHTPEKRPRPDEFAEAMKQLVKDLATCRNPSCFWGAFPSQGDTVTVCPMCSTPRDQVTFDL